MGGYFAGEPHPLLLHRLLAEREANTPGQPKSVGYSHVNIYAKKRKVRNATLLNTYVF
jgi:hypothetical protein